MRGLLELISLLAMFTMIGALIYAAFQFVAVSSEFGDGSSDLTQGTYQGLRVSVCAAIVIWITSIFRKRI